MMMPATKLIARLIAWPFLRCSYKKALITQKE
jgi:hypothetical protein